MPRASFVVVETELVFSGLEAVLDCPAMALDLHEGGDPGSSRTPGREEHQFAVGYMAPDQQAPGPHPGASLTVIVSVDIGEFEASRK